jgi:hypothetical protein
MFFLDMPYVSKFLQKSLKESFAPVVQTPASKKLDLIDGLNIISEEEAVNLVKKRENLPLYCTSENSIGWICKNLSFTALPEKINLFKDKLRFRNLIKPLFPEFYFKAIKYGEFDTVKYEEFPKEFIIKPAVGFMSAGVHLVSSKIEFQNAIKSIKKELKEIEGLYPEEVLSAKEFIVEEVIYGDEYAIDVYFDLSGEAVILTILKHMFFDEADVGDRVYSSSKSIIEENLEEFKEFLNKIGKLADIKNLPLHVELRKSDKGKLSFIELNPMRFGGWCTTADITHIAYGFNPYLYYYEQKRPDWSEILKDKGDELYSIVVLDNSTGVSTKDIKTFDYEKFLSKFKNPLELRKIDFSIYPVFGFLFVKTKQEDIKELEDILASDLREFISLF